MLEAFVRELDPIAAETLQFCETGQQGHGLIRDRSSADGEVLDGGEASENAKIGLRKGIALHRDLSDDTCGLRNLGS